MAQRQFVPRVLWVNSNHYPLSCRAQIAQLAHMPILLLIYLMDCPELLNASVVNLENISLCPDKPIISSVLKIFSQILQGLHLAILVPQGRAQITIDKIIACTFLPDNLPHNLQRSHRQDLRVAPLRSLVQLHLVVLAGNQAAVLRGNQQCSQAVVPLLVQRANQAEVQRAAPLRSLPASQVQLHLVSLAGNQAAVLRGNQQCSQAVVPLLVQRANQHRSQVLSHQGSQHRSQVLAQRVNPPVALQATQQDSLQQHQAEVLLVIRLLNLAVVLQENRPLNQAVIQHVALQASLAVVRPVALRDSQAASLLPSLPRCLLGCLHRSLQVFLQVRLLANQLLGLLLHLQANPRGRQLVNLLNLQQRTRGLAQLVIRASQQ